LPIFKAFVLSFADRINQLKFVALGLMASTECSDDNERLAFLTALSNKVNKPESQDAYVYALADVANVKLRVPDLDGAQKDLAACQKVLDSFDSVETVVHASFYKVNADYYHTKQEFASFYKNALLYLACIDLEELPETERVSRAYSLSVAALVSDSIYNFGELLLHPILDSLTETPHNWLRDLLFAFNRGDLTAYDVLAGNISKNKLLESHRMFLYQKISLSALTEMVFRRPPHDRSLAFGDIASETKVQPDEIEHLVMKALSLGLLKGSIDQVGQVAHIHWVQPKVLDMKQIDGMRNRLKDWDAGVNQLGHWIEGVGKDVWAAVLQSPHLNDSPS
jgi:26S proteasome regulatory subunit N9